MEMKAKEIVRKFGRRYSDEFRAAVLAACEAPGARVSEVAARQGLNTNLVYKWIQRARYSRGVSDSTKAGPTTAFVPLRLVKTVVEPMTLELSHREITVRLAWAAPAVDDLARLLRGVLQ